APHRFPQTPLGILEARKPLGRGLRALMGSGSLPGVVLARPTVSPMAADGPGRQMPGETSASNYRAVRWFRFSPCKVVALPDPAWRLFCSASTSWPARSQCSSSRPKGLPSLSQISWARILILSSRSISIVCSSQIGCLVINRPSVLRVPLLQKLAGPATAFLQSSESQNSKSDTGFHGLYLFSVFFLKISNIDGVLAV